MVKQTTKCWRAGKNSLVITITSNLRNALGIEEGDYVEADISIVKKDNTHRSRSETKADKKPKKGFIIE